MTPMMKQYLAIKEDYKDTILFFRLGDFYEMFLDDALIASAELGITLTSRSKGTEKDKNPMCGVPYHAAESYISKLVSKGYKVAICEQMEDPKSVKGIVKRDVVKVVTPGTLTDTNALDDKSNNYLCAIYRSDTNYGVAFADITTGDFFVTESRDSTKLINELARYSPSEIILNAVAYSNASLVGEIKNRFACLCEQSKLEPQWEHSAELILDCADKESLSELNMPEDLHTVNAAGELLTYLEQTQKAVLINLKPIKYYSCDEYMDIDIFTRRNLELTETMRTASKKGTLLSVLDKTKTSMGGRMLKSFLEKPLTNCTKIQKRLFAVEALVKHTELRQDLMNALDGVQDLERLIGRVVCKSATPKELVSLKRSLLELPAIELSMAQLDTPLIRELTMLFDVLGDVLDLLDASILDEAPNIARDGGIIKPGYDEEVDVNRDLKQNGRAAVTKMELDEREKTGIKTLKIGYNRVFGYYIDVPKSFQGDVPETYQRRQTLANNERYITEELKALEDKLLGAEERQRQREYKLFCDIRDAVAAEVARVQQTASVLAMVDVLCSLAETAARNNYVMPTVDVSDVISIRDGRHPVVEKMLKDELFVPNDATLNCGDDRFLIITGPNMAGKSTYMRQVALIVLMAQIGSFVPASACTVGICDKIFTRIGASDDLSAGQSTFMVEMTELSAILQNATPKSLLLLDEIGRGTSTFDGLSIAWSAAEYISGQKKLGAKTLFATHYHELTALEEKLPGIKNYSIACKKHGDKVTFLRRIVRGGADDSYGIEVAALAGLPPKLISRAKEILAEIENRENRHQSPVMPVYEKEQDMQLGIADLRCEEVVQRLENLDVTTLTPIEALNILYELQNKVKR